MRAICDPTMTPCPRARKHRHRKVMYMIDNLLGMGGAEGSLLKMVNHLPAYGYECSIITFETTRQSDFLSLFKCPVFEFPLTCTYDLQAVRVAFQIRNLVAQQQPDILHTMFPTSDVWGGPIASLGRDMILISSRRDLGIVREWKHQIAYRLLGHTYDQVQAVSEAARAAALAQDRLDPEKVKTVHNGIDFDWIDAEPAWPNLDEFFPTPSNGPTVITAVGKVWPVKGVDVFLKAAAKVAKHVPDVRFIVAGFDRGEYPQQVKAECQALGLGSRVAFIGRVAPIISIIKACNVFCLLSRSEGLSNALLEAMSCGLPCIATAVGGTPEVLTEGRNGFLVPKEDADAAADRILHLLADRALARRIGANARNHVRQHFTVNTMVSRVAELYTGLLQERN